jgi:hypothetical protein
VSAVNTKAALVLVAVFALGAVAGVGGAIAYTRDEINNFADQPSMREFARFRALSRKLDLSAGQESDLRKTFERHSKERRKVWVDAMERCGDPIKKQKAELDAEIRKVLNEEQRAQFDRFANARRPPGGVPVDAP